MLPLPNSKTSEPDLISTRPLLQGIEGTVNDETTTDENQDFPDKTTVNEEEPISVDNIINPYLHFKESFLVIADKEYRHIVLPLVLALMCFVSVCSSGHQLHVLYMKNKPFMLSTAEVSYVLAENAVARGLGVIITASVSFYWLKITDYGMVIIGAISIITFMILMGVARSGLAAVLVAPTSFALPISVVALRSIITKQVSPDRYGAIMSSLEAMETIAVVITLFATLWLYQETLSFYTGMPYFILAVSALAGLIITIVQMKRYGFSFRE